MRYVSGSSGFDFWLVSSLTKGIFIMRKSSEGLGLSDQELAELSNPANRKRLPTIADLRQDAAQSLEPCRHSLSEKDPFLVNIGNWK